MPSDLRDLMTDLEVSLVGTVGRLERAETDFLFVGVLDLERRIEALHHALASVADTIADQRLLGR